MLRLCSVPDQAAATVSPKQLARLSETTSVVGVVIWLSLAVAPRATSLVAHDHKTDLSSF